MLLVLMLLEPLGVYHAFLLFFGLVNFNIFIVLNIFFSGRYLAPEYFMHGRVTEKIDVYAFGVVLLELLSSRKPINNESPKGQESLVMWVSSFSVL